MPRPFLPSFRVPGPIERGAGLFAAFLAAVEAMGERRGGGWASPTRPLPGFARQRARSGALAPLRRRPGVTGLPEGSKPGRPSPRPWEGWKAPRPARAAPY